MAQKLKILQDIQLLLSVFKLLFLSFFVHFFKNLLSYISCSIFNILNYICFYTKPSGLEPQQFLICLFLHHLPPQQTHRTFMCFNDLQSVLFPQVPA